MHRTGFFAALAAIGIGAATAGSLAAQAPDHDPHDHTDAVNHAHAAAGDAGHSHAGAAVDCTILASPRGSDFPRRTGIGSRPSSGRWPT